MLNQMKTTVIGSYPIELNVMDLVKNYFNDKEINWKKYIKLAVNDMVNSGIDIISDGQTRDSFINIFTRKLKGCRIRKVTEIVDKVEYNKPITIEDQIFVKSLISGKIELIGILAGPYTLSESVIDMFYNDKKELAFDFAYALKKEARILQEYVDIISIDEPYFSNNFPDYGKELIEIITKDIKCKTRLHICGNIKKIVTKLFDLHVDILSHEFKASPNLIDLFKDYNFSQKICFGSVRSDNIKVESVEEIIKHINKGISVFGDKICQLSPDCGLRLLPRKIAFQKLKNLSIAGGIINERQRNSII